MLINVLVYFELLLESSGSPYRQHAGYCFMSHGMSNIKLNCKPQQNISEKCENLVMLLKYTRIGVLKAFTSYPFLKFEVTKAMLFSFHLSTVLLSYTFVVVSTCQPHQIPSPTQQAIHL